MGKALEPRSDPPVDYMERLRGARPLGRPLGFLTPARCAAAPRAEGRRRAATRGSYARESRPSHGARLAEGLAARDDLVDHVAAVVLRLDVAPAPVAPDARGELAALVPQEDEAALGAGEVDDALDD